jgi:hypothetical protein
MAVQVNLPGGASADLTNVTDANFRTKEASAVAGADTATLTGTETVAVIQGGTLKNTTVDDLVTGGLPADVPQFEVVDAIAVEDEGSPNYRVAFKKYKDARIGNRSAPHFAADTRYTNILANGLEAKTPDDPVDVLLGRWETVSGDGLDGTDEDYADPAAPSDGNHIAGIYGIHYPGSGNWELEIPPGGNWRHIGRNCQINFMSRGAPTDTNRGGYLVFLTVPEGTTILRDKFWIGDQGRAVFMGNLDNSLYSAVNLRNGKGQVTILAGNGSTFLALRHGTDATDGYDWTVDISNNTLTLNGVESDVGSDIASFHRTTKAAVFSGALTAKSHNTGSATVNDDTAISFTPPAATGILLVEDGSSQYFMAFFRVDSSPAMTAMITLPGSIVTTTGVLTGTTGTDAKINVSAANDGKIYIENRIGGARAITYTVICRPA